jgi:hypothetical protein
MAISSTYWAYCIQHTFLILLDVEPSQQHDSLLAKYTSIGWVWWIDCRTTTLSARSCHYRATSSLGMDIQHASGAAETFVTAPIVNFLYTILSQHASTHDAGFDRDIECRFLDDLKRVLCEDLLDGDEFRMTCAIEGAISVVHAATNDDVVVHEHTAHRSLISEKGVFCLGKISDACAADMNNITIFKASRMKSSCFSRSAIGCAICTVLSTVPAGRAIPASLLLSLTRCSSHTTMLALLQTTTLRRA